MTLAGRLPAGLALAAAALWWGSLTVPSLVQWFCAGVTLWRVRFAGPS